MKNYKKTYKKALKKSQSRNKKSKKPDLSGYVYYGIYQYLKSAFSDEQEIIPQEPPEHVEADIAVSADVKKVKEAAEKINNDNFDYFKKAEVQGPFLNIFLNYQNIFNDLLSNVEKLDDKYGENNSHYNKLAIIEYSSPNIAKPISIGHLRTTVIGQVLSNIYEANGYTVLRDNYLGDWGTQFGKVAYAYQKWGEGKELNVKNLKDLYIKFQKEYEKDESIIEEARNILKKLEDEDEKLTKLWKKVKELSVKDLKSVYQKLGVEFDHYSGESLFLNKAKDLIKDCLDRKVCKKGKKDAIIVEPEDLPTFLMEKSDGSTLYHSRDLAQLKARIEELNPDELLYVVGNEQKLHFRQLFTLAEKLGYLQDLHPKHIGFGLVLGDDGKKMSTRHGTGADLKRLINKAIEKSLAIVEEKSSNLSSKNKKEIAEKVGIGAIIYNDISHSRNKDISFDWNQMLNFESGSAAYLQYTNARINSIKEKYEEKFNKPQKPNKFIF
ncbi:MAG TPA: arginine--tRNA ligase, partial [Candidatus Paceibacterota bacterium]|nr:arginine--tRNA ligase [Candidatus Paceibacterota bacterium]